MKILGVDTGGTFTDFVLSEDGSLRTHKVLSTPSAPEEAIMQGIAEMNISLSINKGEMVVVHGSTVATNAALEGKGVRTVYVANKGLKDILTIGRQTRRELYNLNPSPEPPPVPKELCLEVPGRVDAEGRVSEFLSDEQINALVEQIRQLKPDAVAVNLLFSFLNDEHEKRIARALPEDLSVSCSSFVLPEYKEYERGIATWLNAWLGPIVETYLCKLQKELASCPITIMQSSGGTIEISQAAKRAVNLLLSGPAGGLAAAQDLGRRIGCEQILTFDMGGTSTDVALVEGDIKLTSEGRIGRYPVAVPMVDMHTIGAGGGSIAWIDQGGLLQVGPHSAGADPGPACYNKGGSAPTVTDANMVLGRIPEVAKLGGYLQLDRSRSVDVIKKLADQLGLETEEAALGVVRISNEYMVRALREISVQQGHSPRGFILCCFGGAGGLHVCDLADELNMSDALAPINSGVFSAFGMLAAPRQRHFTRTVAKAVGNCREDELNEIFAVMVDRARSELRQEKVPEEKKMCIRYEIDTNYVGQSYFLTLPYTSLDTVAASFHTAHEKRFGYQLPRPVRIVNIKVTVTATSEPIEMPGQQQGRLGTDPKFVEVSGIGKIVPVFSRNELNLEEDYVGPLIVIEKAATTWVKPGWKCRRDSLGNLRLKRFKQNN